MADTICTDELPFGPPPVFPDIKDELREYIECPERLPIHQMENVQIYWARDPDILQLLEYDLSPVGTTLKFDRDPITGCISNMREDVLQGAGETTRNSMSMSRAPGPPSDGLEGNSSNFPFWPGGFDEPDISKTVPEADLDFEKNLRTLAKGFRAGIEFKKDNCTPININAVIPTIANNSKNAEDKVGSGKMDKVNLMAMIHDEENQLGLWTSTPKTVEETEEPQVPEDPELSKLGDIEELPLESWNVPVIKITDKKTANLHAEWAEQLDVSVPVVDYDKRVPKPAIKFEYELDTFQKQAIMKLEEGCNVFVAAHTSAGKTTVAEYAIALSQRHMTRIIYTSPIKALSNQKYRDFKRNKAFDSIGLITGDMQINQAASCLIMTTEILRTMLYNASEVLRDLEYVIFDEVHYINDETRGHVWEEIVILLPSTVNIVMLSATVPNPLVFANWVGGIKKRKMFVISTLKRPVPLEHYLYLGTNNQTKNNRVLLQNADGQFLLDSWYKAKTMKDQATSAEDAKLKQAGRANTSHMRRPQLTPKQVTKIWQAFIAHLKENEKMPVVMFTLSRNRCDANANALQNVDLTTQQEKDHVRSFFKRCIKCLNEPDRELPQIKQMEKLLSRGIGVHHSGILPILKEIIELLFQNGIVKLLFATETFAMGINMPARTVVFDSVRKYDGRQFRCLLPTEYIQMAGRAGRRGHDSTGTVMIMCKTEVPPLMDLKTMMCGQAQNLESHFKITYAMVLNLRRVSESVSVEDMMRKSFKEMKLASGEKTFKYELERLESSLAELPPLNDYEKDLTAFCNTAVEYLEERRQIHGYMLGTRNALKSLTGGRVLLISHRDHYNKLGMLLGIVEENHENMYKVLILANNKVNADGLDEWIDDDDKADKWYEMIALTKRQLFVPEGGAPSHLFLKIPNTSILEITNCVIRVDYNLVLKDCEKRQMDRFKNDPPSPTCQLAIQELLALSLMALQNSQILMPYMQLTLNKPELLTRLKYMYHLVSVLSKFNCTQVPDFEEQFKKVFLRNEMERTKADLRFKLSAEGLALYPDYVNRVNILKELGYIDTDDRVTLKGRVALDMGTQELLITELVYRNLLTNLQPAVIAALLSATVYQRGGDSDLPQLPVLKETCEIIDAVRTEIENMENKYGVDPIEPLNFGLAEVVYEWARAEPFAKIMKLTDVQEGIIVRCIQQLNDTLRDVKVAATRIGETVLKEKMEEASTAIKRDIVFTASLYTQD